MTTPSLREAAQALVNAWFGDDGSGDAAVADRHFDALRAALALPEPRDAAPEAPAESEVGWIVQAADERHMNDRQIHISRRGAENEIADLAVKDRGWRPVRVRVTVEPAPVEPEETP